MLQPQKAKQLWKQTRYLGTQSHRGAWEASKQTAWLGEGGRILWAVAANPGLGQRGHWGAMKNTPLAPNIDALAHSVALPGAWASGFFLQSQHNTNDRWD